MLTATALSAKVGSGSWKTWKSEKKRTYWTFRFEEEKDPKQCKDANGDAAHRCERRTVRWRRIELPVLTMEDPTWHTQESRPAQSRFAYSWEH